MIAENTRHIERGEISFDFQGILRCLAAQDAQNDSHGHPEGSTGCIVGSFT
jgi:hypothetical protein